MKGLIVAVGLLAGCGPIEDEYVSARHRAQLQVVYAEAERVQQVVTQAQAGCRALEPFPEAYWLMDCYTILQQPQTLTVTLLRAER